VTFVCIKDAWVHLALHKYLSVNGLSPFWEKYIYNLIR